METSSWIRCKVCGEWHNLATEKDGEDYMTFYGTPERRGRRKLNGRQPYASISCLCVKCIKAISELVDEIETN